jgi:hypothetical protein
MHSTLDLCVHIFKIHNYVVFMSSQVARYQLQVLPEAEMCEIGHVPARSSTSL